MIALRGIYYNLNMGPELEAIEAEMNKYKKRDFQIYLKIITIMFNKIVEFLFCADIIKTPKVFCLTFGVH
mgnify:CR=1 FL=1